VSQALAHDRLGPVAIGSTIASSVAPLTVTALVVATALAATGLIGVPIAIIAVAALLNLFSVGYMAMARHIDNAGAFYAYVAQGIGRPVGVGTAWFALATYNSFQLCCYGGLGSLAAPLVEEWTGVELPWFLFAFAAWILVAFLGAHEVKLSGKVLMVLVIVETVLVVVYTVSIMLTPGFAFNLDALSLRNLWMPGVGTLGVIGMTAFAGIEQSVVYGEESKDRRRTIPRATYGTIAIVAAVYVFASLVVISAGGPQIIGRATTEGGDLFFNLATVVLGASALLVGKVALGSSLFAALQAFHQAIARYTFALGREGVLPRAFGNTVKGAPRNASFAQSALAFCVLVVYAIAGWDPLVQLFYYGSTTGGLGILLLITLATIAVIFYFARATRGENVWRRLIAPLTAAVILLYLSYEAIESLPVQYNVEPGTGPAKIVPIALLVIFAAGTAWGLILKFTKPAVYEGIGLGTRSSAAGASGLASVL
jgi:amino acid transporter